MAEYLGNPRDFKVTYKNPHHNVRSVKYTLNDLHLLGYDKVKKFTDLKFENHNATVRKMMKSLKTKDP